MDILHIRYILSGEIELIFSIIGIIVSLPVLFKVVKPESEEKRVLYSRVAVILILILLINAYMMKDYTYMPNVESLTLDSAKQTLFELGFTNVLTMGEDRTSIFDTAIIRAQSTKAGSIIKKSKPILLLCIPNDEYNNAICDGSDETNLDTNSHIDTEHIENSKKEDNSINIDKENTATSGKYNDNKSEEAVVFISNDDININTENYIEFKNEVNLEKNTSSIANSHSEATVDNLTIIIEDYEFFSNGFHYERPENENTVNVVDYYQGISGHFSYSRKLTNVEFEHWFHSGKLFDISGQECEFVNSCFASSEGIFAFDLSPNIPAGDYVYILYLIINYKDYEARISFSI